MEKQITNIEQNLDLVEVNGRKFYLLGTAHVSKRSADFVSEKVKELNPDTVAVELCEPRYKALTNPNRWRETNLYQVIKQGDAYTLMAQLALSGFQRRIGKELNIKPGQEMLEAVNAATEVNSQIELIDRSVKVTLKRAWANASFWSLTKIFFSAFASLFTSGHEITEAEIEALKEDDALTAVVLEFSAFLPGIKEVLIDERDKYMAAKLLNGPGQTVLAVVGAGHIPGIKRYLGESIDLAELEKIPDTRLSFKILGWSIPAAVVGMIVFGFFHSGADTTMEMAKAWVLYTGLFCGAFTALALAHPLTVITGIIAAPLTTLHPALAAGWFCGLTEAYLKKPRVMDLESIASDLESLSGIWKNRVSKILLIVALSNLGASIGMLIAAGKIAALL